MAFIFNSSVAGNKDNRGRVVVLEQPNAAGDVRAVENWEGFSAFKCIFTRLQVAEHANYQFLHTLGDRIYLYVFGDRIGELTLSGLAFQDNCTDDTQIGVSHALNYYRNNRLVRRANPLLVTIDPSTVLEVYLQAFQAATLGDAAENIFQFNMSFALLPEDKNAPNLAIDNETRPPGDPVV